MGKFIFKYLFYEKERLFLTWFLSFSSSIICLLPAPIISRIIDLATSHCGEKKLIYLAFVLGVIYIMTAVLNFLTGNIAIQMKTSIYQKMCKDTYRAMMNLSVRDWGNVSKETLYQNCIEDVKAINVISAEKLLEVFTYFVSAIGALIYIGNIYWPLLILLGLIYSGYFLPAHLLGKRYTEFERKARQSGYDLRKEFTEIFDRIRLIRIHDMENREVKRFIERSNEWGAAKYQLVQWYNIFKSIPRFLDSFAPAVVFLLGGYMITQGTMTIGQIVGITVLLPRLNAPIRYYSSYSIQIREAFAKLREVYQLHNSIAAEEGNKTKIMDIESIILENVTIKIDNKIILEDFNYRFESGIKVGITGETGAGKSTLFLAILGLTDIEKGTIYINGIPLDEIDKISLRKKICVMQQSPYVFNKGLKENIMMYQDVDEKVISKYEKMIGLTEIDSFSSSLGTDGIKLSGGQKQMMGALRLLTSNSKWYLCDEITSAVDNKRKNLLVKLLLQEKGTVLFITHQLDLLKEFDEIIIMGNGRILETGTHKELIEKNGKYKELYKKYEFK